MTVRTELDCGCHDSTPADLLIPLNLKCVDDPDA